MIWTLSPSDAYSVASIRDLTNFFAACLLMPRRFLEADPDAALVDVEDAQAVARLAKRYGVSAHAKSIRLGTLAARRG